MELNKCHSPPYPFEVNEWHSIESYDKFIEIATNIKNRISPLSINDMGAYDMSSTEVAIAFNEIVDLRIAWHHMPLERSDYTEEIHRKKYINEAKEFASSFLNSKSNYYDPPPKPLPLKRKNAHEIYHEKRDE